MREPLLQAIRAWIISRLDLPQASVIIGQEGRPPVLPARPCVVVTTITHGRATGTDEEVSFTTTVDDEEVFFVGVVGMRQATVTIALYSETNPSTGAPDPDPHDALEDLLISLGMPTVRETHAKAGMAIDRLRDPQALPTLRPTEWEPAANCDVLVSYTAWTLDSPGSIERVILSIDLDGHVVTVDGTEPAPEEEG